MMFCVAVLGVMAALTPTVSGNDCVPSDSCALTGGHCVSRRVDCTGIVDPRGCIGTGTGRCMCCIPGAMGSNITEKLDYIIKRQGAIGSNITENLEYIEERQGAMDSRINLLEIELMSVNDNQEIANSKLDTIIDLLSVDLCRWYDGVQFEGQCLIFSDDALSWDDAAAACSTKHGLLAGLKNNPSEVVAYIRTTYGGVEFWAGGSDTANEGSWVWTDGEPFDNFPWSVGQPDNAGGIQNCLVVNWGNAGLDDQQCHFTKRYICELGVSSPNRYIKRKINKTYETQKQQQTNNTSFGSSNNKNGNINNNSFISSNNNDSNINNSKSNNNNNNNNDSHTLI